MSEPEQNKPSFRRQDLIILTLLIVFTFGIYWVWWMLRQTAVVNAHFPAAAVPAWISQPATAVVILHVVLSFSFVLGNVDGAATTAPPHLQVSSLVALVLSTLWTLGLRRAFNVATGAKPGEPAWISLPLTLLLVVVQLAPVYLQYVVNRELERRGRA